MTEPTDLDLLRAFADGTLPAAARQAFEARLAREPDLARASRAWAEVAAWPEPPLPASRLRGADLRLDDAPASSARPLRFAAWIAAAAAVLVAAFVFLRRPPVAEGPVVLAAIPLLADGAPPPPPPVPEPIPASAETYVPAADGALSFAESWPTGRVLASLAARRAVVFVQVPGCPICQGMKRGLFRDPAVLAAVEPFVLAEVDAMKPPPADLGLSEADFERWPVFLVLDPDGTRVARFGGDLDASALVAALREAAGAAAPRTGGWGRVHDLATILRRADATPALGTRWALLDAAARAATGDAPLARAVAGRQSALAADAAAALVAARERARAAPADGLAALDVSVRRFEGTPFAADLARVRDRLAATRVFPDVRPAPELPR